LMLSAKSSAPTPEAGIEPTYKAQAEQQQHVQMYRKLLLRRRLCRWATRGSAYVPFIGDGDIAAALYADSRVYGADLDPARVEVAASRLPRSDVIVADCDEWTFPGTHVQVASADKPPIFNFYLPRFVWPWFDELVSPWRVVHRSRYLRGWMVYWGAVVERP
jgi:hypothetical protein